MRYREMRLPCDTELAASLGDEMRRLRFVNISASGARVEGLAPLPRDALVVLHHLGVRHATRVVWANERQAGLRFVRSLSAAELGHLRGTGGPRLGGWAPPGQPRLRELT